MFDFLRGKLLAITEIETTGNDPEKHEIIELAVIFARVDDNGLRMMNIFDCPVKPEHLETADAEHLKITTFSEPVWEACAPSIRRVTRRLLGNIEDEMKREGLSGVVFIGEDVLNKSKFLDRALLAADVNDVQYEKLDVKTLATIALNFSTSLCEVCTLFNMSLDPPPRKALKDAVLVYKVLDALLSKKS